MNKHSNLHGDGLEIQEAYPRDLPMQWWIRANEWIRGQFLN